MFRPKSKLSRPMSEIAERAAPACFPRARQPETTGIISWIVSPDLCSGLCRFSIASKDIVLKDIVPRTAAALRPWWQQVEGHAEDNVDGNDQGSELLIRKLQHQMYDLRVPF